MTARRRDGCHRARLGSADTVVKLEDKVVRQGEVIKAQQMRDENLTERMIRLGTTIELVLRASENHKLN